MKGVCVKLLQHLKPSVCLQERQRRYLSLSPWDKATLSLVSPPPASHPLDMLPAASPLTFVCVLPPQGRVILSNKMARTIAFFYTLFLHCLVFLVQLSAPQVSEKPRTGAKLLTFVVSPSQVLYKTAWSESIGRDCSAFCAKKFVSPLATFPLARSVTPYLTALPSLSSLPRYSDHLHRFHENDPNL